MVSAFDDTEIRIVVFSYPSTLISARNDNKQFVRMVLFNNGSGDGLADSAFAFRADSDDRNGFHDQESLV